MTFCSNLGRFATRAEPMKFKDNATKKDWERLSWPMQILGNQVDREFLEEAQTEAVATSIHRDEPKSVHGWGRGIDFRVQFINAQGEREWYVPREVAQRIVDKINARFPRDHDGKHTALLHEVEGSTLHIHVQLPPLVSQCVASPGLYVLK